MSAHTTVVLASLWRNDTRRNLVGRVEHLLAKAETYPNLRWLWITGDNTDTTERDLKACVAGYDVSIVRRDSLIKSDDAWSRLRRLSITAQEIFNYRNLRPSDSYILYHESDIISPSDLVNRMVTNAEKHIIPVAAWPIIRLPDPAGKQFYDIWAFRKNGVPFTPLPPHAKGWDPARPFTVDSFGTVWMIDAGDAHFIHLTSGAVLELCTQLREHSRVLWVDPKIVVEQPYDLWTWRDTRQGP